MTRTVLVTVALVLAVLLAACGTAGGPTATDVDEPVVVLARGDGWRDGLMDAVGLRYLVIEVAEPGMARQAWEDNVTDGLPTASGPPDEPGVYVPFEEVDPTTHAIVVVSSGTSSSCPTWPADLRLRDSHVEVDLEMDVAADAPCTDDLVPYRAVLAVERDRLPMSDALPLEDIDVPSENLTGVDGVVTPYPAG